ncbi:class D sortase [Terriglobus sp.]|uniref:class D sortase n=1 Tax=Terriglobus sp. TaxID=1889013 RepID=UPI003B00CA03
MAFRQLFPVGCACTASTAKLHSVIGMRNSGHLSTRNLIAERILWLGALVCLGFGSVTLLMGVRTDREASQRYPASSVHTQQVSAEASHQTSPGAHVEGRLQIAALNLSAPILSECSDSALRLGSCHVPGTAVAGGLGNMGIAGHRDGTFRSLRNIRAGQLIDIFAEEGHFQYSVDTMVVVPADDISVLAIRDQPELTLITCFPFNYVGAAPKRFIVHAHLISVDGVS